MSFLYHHKTRKVIQAIWGVIAILVAIGMVLFFAPGVVELLFS